MVRRADLNMAQLLMVPLWAILFLCGCSAFELLGHDAIGLIASKYVSTATRDTCQKMLGDTTDRYLANVGTWADEVRNQMSETSPWHGMHAQSQAPGSCALNYPADCGSEGCLITGIEKYTKEARGGDANALKFLIHFIGDLHQPLHMSCIDQTGFGYKVTLDGKDTNLHTAFDSGILDKAFGGGGTESQAQLADNVTQSIDAGDFQHEAASWVEGTNPDDVVGTIMKWAQESITLCCTDSVLPAGGPNPTTEVSIDGEYYDKALPMLTKQVARGNANTLICGDE